MELLGVLFSHLSHSLTTNVDDKPWSTYIQYCQRICLPGLLDNSTDPTNFSHWLIYTSESNLGTYSFRIELITARVKGEALSVVYVLIIAACLKADRHIGD